MSFRPMLAFAAFLLVCRAVAIQAVVLGGGNVNKDCTVGFSGVNATNGDIGVICHDGDPSCDLDGVADGVCHFDVSFCAHLSSDGCTAAAVDSAKVSGLPLDVPPLPVAAKKCGADDPLAVPMNTAVGATAVARESGALKDVDYMNLCCRATSEPLEAQLCAVDVELSIAGCARPVGKRIERPWHMAHELVTQASHQPLHAKKLLNHAIRLLTRMQARAHTLGTIDVCGDTLGLIAQHGITSIQNYLQ